MIYNSIREGEGIMNYILDLLLKQIFTQPFLLLAIVVFIGYLAMKQTVGKALIGAFKASIGIIVMGIVPAPCPRTLDLISDSTEKFYRTSGCRPEYLLYHDSRL